MCNWHKGLILYTLNKRIDGLESNLNQKIDNLQYSITKINKLLEVQER